MTEIRHTLESLLAARGHRVYGAENGFVGSQLLDQHAIDVLITDIVMPEQDGFELLRSLRAKNPDVRVVAMSGGGQAISPENCLRVAKALGADVTLRKPFELAALIQAVEGPSATGDA